MGRQAGVEPPRGPDHEQGKPGLDGEEEGRVLDEGLHKGVGLDAAGTEGGQRREVICQLPGDKQGLADPEEDRQGIAGGIAKRREIARDFS